MDKITADQVKAIVAAQGVRRMVIHHCSMCNYPCAYVFEGDQVAYDSGCDCVTYNSVTPRTYEDVASHFNIQTPEIGARMWGEFCGAGALPDLDKRQ